MSITKPEIAKKQRLIRLPEVMQRVGLSNSHIYALQARGQFPKPIKLIENLTWDEFSKLNALQFPN